MAYLVIAYPELQQRDFDWIQGYRKQNNPRFFSIVKPHFTVVFPIDDLVKGSFIAEVKQTIRGVRSFDFDIKVATINQDNFGGYYHEFLVPDVGYSDVVKLHDKMYSGLFVPYLRLDIDFIPHIGIGDSDEAQASKQRIDELNTQGISIHGRIDSIDVVEYADEAVTTLEKFELH